MPAGWKLAQIQAAERRHGRPCARCGHAISAHREYPPADARYRPLLFRCGECECEGEPHELEGDG